MPAYQHTDVPIELNGTYVIEAGRSVHVSCEREDAHHERLELLTWTKLEYSQHVGDEGRDWSNKPSLARRDPTSAIRNKLVGFLGESPSAQLGLTLVPAKPDLMVVTALSARNRCSRSWTLLVSCACAVTGFVHKITKSLDHCWCLLA